MAYTISQAAAGLGTTTVAASKAILGTKTTGASLSTLTPTVAVQPVGLTLSKAVLASRFPIAAQPVAYQDTTPVAVVQEGMSDSTFYALLGGAGLLAIGGIWYAFRLAP